MNPLIILFLFVGCGAAFLFSWLSRFSTAPQTIEATIMEKNEFRQVIHIPRRVVVYKYTLVFDYEGKPITLFCDENDYLRFQIGDCGKVTFSGEMMLKFEKA